MTTSSGIPRPVELAVALGGLAVLSPLLVLSAALVAITSGLPVLFRHERMGRGGRPFVMYKFRSMRTGAPGPAVTAGGDPRITRIGRFLRKTKLDELPELWNVVTGDMSFVGPRPEATRYVDLSDARWQRVLSVRPGITDPTTLSLIDEEALLASAPGDPERYYLDELLPKKLDGYIEYLDHRTWRSDAAVFTRTVASLLTRFRKRP